jgi:hypothetical protein
MTAPQLTTVLKILDNENNLSQRADQKAVAALSSLGVFMVFFIVYYRSIPVNVFTVPIMFLYFSLAAMSIIWLISALRPRVGLKGAKQAGPNVSFFGSICRFPDADSYCQALAVQACDESAAVQLFSRQIFEVAQINAVKYKYINRAIFTAISALLVELVIIFYLFLVYWGSHVPLVI